MRNSACMLSLIGMATCLVLVGCRATPPPAPPAPSRPASGLFEWRGDGRAVSRIEISVEEQLMRIYSADEEVAVSFVATGLRGFPTPIGEFKVIEKVVNKFSNLYGKGYDASGKLTHSDFRQGRDVLPPGGRFAPAPMTYFMRLTNDGVGLHVGIIPSPGKRASHGCIRMPAGIAGKLFQATALGTPVSIVENNAVHAQYQQYLALNPPAPAGNAAGKSTKATKPQAPAAAPAAAPAEPVVNPGASPMPL